MRNNKHTSNTLSVCVIHRVDILTFPGNGGQEVVICPQLRIRAGTVPFEGLRVCAVWTLGQSVRLSPSFFLFLPPHCSPPACSLADLLSVEMSVYITLFCPWSATACSPSAVAAASFLAGILSPRASPGHDGGGEIAVTGAPTHLPISFAKYYLKKTNKKQKTPHKQTLQRHFLP